MLASVSAIWEGTCNQQGDGPFKAHPVQQDAVHTLVRLCGAGADQGQKPRSALDLLDRSCCAPAADCQMVEQAHMLMNGESNVFQAPPCAEKAGAVAQWELYCMSCRRQASGATVSGQAV